MAELGGLAAVTEEEEMGPPEASAIDVSEIVGRTTGSGEQQSLQSMILKNRDDALERLRAGRAAIAGRRDKAAKEDERSKWLAFAQGMLSSGPTGSFGEGVGRSAGLLREETELRRGHEGERIAEEQLLANEEGDIQNQFLTDEMSRLRLEKESQYGGEYSQRRPIGIDKLYPHPETPGQFARGQQIWDPNMNMGEDEQGNPILGGSRVQWLDLGEDGSVLRAIDRLDPEVQREISFRTGLADEEVKRVATDINEGRDAYIQIGKMTKTLDLMRKVQLEGEGSGGWVTLLQGLSEWFGVDTQDVTDLGVLRNRLGQAVLHGLKNFPGQISEGERKYMESLENGLNKPAGVNIGILEQGLVFQQDRYRRGLAAARAYGTPPDLRALGIDPNAPAGSAPTEQAAPAAKPGDSQGNPIIVGPGVPRPPAGSWVKLPNGKVELMR